MQKFVHPRNKIKRLEDGSVLGFVVIPKNSQIVCITIVIKVKTTGDVNFCTPLYCFEPCVHCNYSISKSLSECLRLSAALVLISQDLLIKLKPARLITDHKPITAHSALRPRPLSSRYTRRTVRDTSDLGLIVLI